MQWSFKQLLQPQEVEDISSVINLDYATEGWDNLGESMIVWYDYKHHTFIFWTHWSLEKI